MNVLAHFNAYHESRTLAHARVTTQQQRSIHLRGPSTNSAAANVHGIRRQRRGPSPAPQTWSPPLAAPGRKDSCHRQPPANRVTKSPKKFENIKQPLAVKSSILLRRKRKQCLAPACACYAFGDAMCVSLGGVNFCQGPRYTRHTVRDARVRLGYHPGSAAAVSR